MLGFHVELLGFHINSCRLIQLIGFYLHAGFSNVGFHSSVEGFV